MVTVKVAGGGVIVPGIVPGVATQGAGYAFQAIAVEPGIGLRGKQLPAVGTGRGVAAVGQDQHAVMVPAGGIQGDSFPLGSLRPP